MPRSLKNRSALRGCARGITSVPSHLFTGADGASSASSQTGGTPVPPVVPWRDGLRAVPYFGSGKSALTEQRPPGFVTGLCDKTVTIPPVRGAPSSQRAFTFVELLVALCIGAMIIAVAAMAYGTIGSYGISRRQVNVQIGLANMVNFYPGSSGAIVAVSEAPSMAATAMANIMRERLYSDISYASAVCCLARNKGNFLRPTTITIPTNIDPRTLVSPDQFRALIYTNSAVYTNFNSSTNLINGATSTTGLTIYILSYTNNPTNNINVRDVRAIYESDWVTVTNAPAGTYASVRRYDGENLTDYYHVFYPGKTNNATNHPVAAFFTKSNTTNGDANYRKAENRPFYFVWWPDPSWVPYPATNELASKYPTNATTPSGARSNYWKQEGTTSYFFVIPAFPSL